MGLFDWITRKRARADADARTAQWQASPAPGRDPLDPFTDVWATESSVRTVTNFIAANIASLPFKAYEETPDGDRRQATGSRLARLLADPSELQGVTRYALFRDLLLDHLLCDRMLALVVPGRDGRPRLRRVAPRNFSIDFNGNEEATGVTVTIDGKSTPLDLPSQAVLLDYGYECCAPIPRTLSPILAEARALADYRRAIATNGARINAYVYRPKEIPWETQDDYDDFTQSLRSFQQDGGREGSIPALKDGMEIRAIDNLFKPLDMDDSAARTAIACAVANLYGISPENLGFRTGNKSNIAAYKEQLWSIELAPYVVAFEEALNRVLPTACGEPGLYIEANLDAKLRGTLETQFQAFSTASGRPFLTTNEVRSMLNRPRLEEGDLLATPLNVTQGGQPSPQDGGRTQNAQEGNQ